MKAHELTSDQCWKLLGASDEGYDFVNALRIRPDWNPEVPANICELLNEATPAEAVEDDDDDDDDWMVEAMARDHVQIRGW